MTKLDVAMENEISEKLNIIFRNLQEFIGADTLKGCLEKNGTVGLYWGTAPTGRPHIAYFLPMIKIADFLKSGCNVTILFADIHAYLDNMKAPWELLNKRTQYYEVLIKGMLRALHVPLDKLRFIRGSDYQLSENYTKTVYQIIGVTSKRDAAKAGCEVVKQINDPFLSGIVYPLLQAIDEEFLGVDVQFGGVDQRKIFMYAEKYLSILGMAKRGHLMNPMIPGLTGGKMSASEEASKIDLLDSKETILKKLQNANCEGKNVETNGILAFLKYIALPIKTQFNHELLNKYDNIEDIENDFAKALLTEHDLKEMIGTILCSLMSNLKEEFVLMGKENLIKEAYPEMVVDSVIEVKEDVNTRSLSIDEFEALANEFSEIRNIHIDKFPEVTTNPSIMWSIRASSEPHIGYLLPIRKLAKLSNTNWEVIILIEDIGAYLHSKHNLNKCPFNLLEERSKLYFEMCRSAFIFFGGNCDNLKLIVGSQFQLSKEYSMMMYQSLSKVTENECSQVIEKMVGNKPEITSNLSSVIYPCISVLDQLHLGATVRLFGERINNEDLLAFNEKLTKRLGLDHKMPQYVSHSNILSLDGQNIMNCAKLGPKTAPKDNTFISICESLEVINKKMKKAFFDPKLLDKDSTLNIIENIIWPQLNETSFCVKRTPENGGDVYFESIDEIRTQLLEDVMHPGDVKAAAASYLSTLLLEPICCLFSKDRQSLLIDAFPDEIKFKKINKKAFNPNKIDTRVSVVKSIVFTNGSYSLSLKCGLDMFTVTSKAMYSLTPGDYCLVIVKASSTSEVFKIIGIMNNSEGVALRLKKKAYMDVVRFPNYEIICPHMKENDESLILKEVQGNYTVRGGHLEWVKDGSKAIDIEFMSCCDSLIHCNIF